MGKTGPVVGSMNIATAAKQEAFLAELTRTLSIAPACERSGVDRKSVYRWMDADPGFKQAVHDAQEQAVDVLEHCAYGRALAGNAMLMMFILNGRRSSIYKYTSRIEHTGPGGGPVQYTVRMLNEDEAPPLPPAEGITVAELEAGEDDDLLEGQLLLTEGDDDGDDAVLDEQVVAAEPEVADYYL
jgi:hypothetical protein